MAAHVHGPGKSKYFSPNSGTVRTGGSALAACLYKGAWLVGNRGANNLIFFHSRRRREGEIRL